MTGPVMQKALDQISATFRQERKDRENILTFGHRVKGLVEKKRYSFAEACRLMNVTGKEIDAAMVWLVWDNAHLNDRFDTDMYKLRPWDYEMSGWFTEQEEQQPTAQIQTFSGAA